jgi:predicted O-methyltransferase YrrM
MTEQHVFFHSAEPCARLVANSGLALTQALAGIGELPEWLRLVPGLSGQKFRLFCNNLLRLLPAPQVLEIGTGPGSTILAAVFNTAARGTTVDDWSAGRAAQASFLAYRNLLRNRDAITQIEQDFRAVDYAALPPADVFFYDGPLDPGDVRDALACVQPALKPQHVLIIDDWNHTPVRKEALAALHGMALPVVWSAEVRTTLDGSHPEVGGEQSDWHNGYFIAVVDRSRQAAASLSTAGQGGADRALAVRLPGEAVALVRPDSQAIAAEVAPEPASASEPAPDRARLREIMLDLESLGDNCELGLVQRSVGAEPLGLLRFAGLYLPSEIRLQKTMEALRRRFEGLGEPGTVVLRPEGEKSPREYLVHETAYSLMYHTFKHEGEIEPALLERQQATSLRYLRQKLLDDLRAADKLYVWRSPMAHDVREVKDLLATLREFGDATLLWVVPQSQEGLPDGRTLSAQEGRARWIGPNLIKGTVSRIAPYHNATDIDYESWWSMLAEAHRLWRERRPATQSETVAVHAD